jgi:hypothetical protein
MLLIKCPVAIGKHVITIRPLGIRVCLVARSRLCQDHKHEASFSGLFLSDGFDGAEHAATDRTAE